MRGKGRTLLTEFESKQVLTRYGISTVDTRIARSEEAAVQFARALGFPVVLKLYSETITHKTDVGECNSTCRMRTEFAKRTK